MKPDLSVYGLSFHDYDPTTDTVKKEIRRLVWDSEEPLSSELLTLTKDIAPLDLPLHARNHFAQNAETIIFAQGSRKGQSCEGWNFTYANAYGSRVNSSWCNSDPWPSLVETNHYTAVLEAVKGSK